MESICMKAFAMYKAGYLFEYNYYYYYYNNMGKGIIEVSLEHCKYTTIIHKIYSI